MIFGVNVRVPTAVINPRIESGEETIAEVDGDQSEKHSVRGTYRHQNSLAPPQGVRRR
jgi:hypothetical protein